MITVEDIADRPALQVHDLAQARAVLRAARESGRPVAVWSPPGAAAYWGAAYFAALAEQAEAAEPRANAAFVLDCGAEAGFVMAALRAGLRALCYTGAEATREKLDQMAVANGAVLLAERPVAADLGTSADPLGAARSALARCR